MQCVQWIDCGTLPDWIVAATAIFAAMVGLRQLRNLAASEAQAATAQETAARAAESMAKLAQAQSTVAESERSQAADQVQIARAMLLLEIDKDFESPAMQESRLAVRTLFNRARREADAELRMKNPSGVRQRANELFSGYATQLWEKFRSADEQEPTLKSTGINDQLSDSAGPQYQKLTKILGWMETVGRLANENLAFESDLIALYDQVFVNVYGYFYKHINDRRTDSVQPNADWMRQAEIFNNRILASRAENERLADSATRSPTRWGGRPVAGPATGEP